MSTSPTPRRAARGMSEMPSMPTGPTRPVRPTLLTTSSYNIEPKSEYLRHALEARRAKDNASTSPPREPIPTPRRSTSGTQPVDPWVEQAVSEEDVPQMTPIRRARRPSDGIPPRMRTQRELQNETEALKAAMFSLNLKLELLKKQNHDLKDQMDEANRRIEELEPMEDENLDLREDNDRLLLRMQDMEEDVIKLRDQNTQLRDENVEIIQIQTDAVAELDKQIGAVEEAADMIFQLEDDKTLLKKEILGLKEQMEKARKASSDAEYRDLGIDGQGTGKCPSRVYSIDESRPSTSHFDSDYYSQPSSPQTMGGKASKESLPYSEPAKKFLEINMTVKRSVQDLKKRVSDISTRRPKTPIPEVPQIPDTYMEPHAQQAIKRTPRRQRPFPILPPSINTALRSPMKVHSATIPRTPTVLSSEGLRGIFRDKKALQTQSRDSRRSSVDYRASLGSKGSHGSHHSHRSQHSEAERASNISPPPRLSSRNARTSSSIEPMVNDIPLETKAPEWAGTPSSPPVDDLTNEPERREQWWKNMNSLPNPNSHKRQSSLCVPMPRLSPTKAPHGMDNERDFFFNGNENEDQFIKRAHGLAPRRREK